MKEPFKIKLVPQKWISIAVFLWSTIFLLSFVTSKIEMTSWYIFSILFSSLIVGVTQHHLVFLGHDGSHGLITENNKYNDFLTKWVIFVPFLVHLGNYRKFHTDHHLFVGGANDSELPLKEYSKEKYISPQKTTTLLSHCIKDLFMAGFLEMNNFILLMMKGKVLKVVSYATVWWLIVGSCLYFSGILMEFVLIWFIALFTVFWASFRLRIYFEHYGLDILSNNQSDVVTHRISFVNSIGWFRLLAMFWGQYHWEHHYNPSVPIYQLAEFRSYLIEEKVEPEIIEITNPVEFLNLI